MELSYEDVQRILEIVDASSLEELHLEIGDFKLVVKKRGGRAEAVAPTTADGPVTISTPVGRQEGTPPVAGAAPGEGARRSSARAPRDGAREVRAPMVGTFYRAPAPGAPPFVEVGARVEPDDVVCLIEVMKLMNSIRAGQRGRVAEILADNGQLVEYGQPLILIDPPD
jgi:acetyl-CoA carboxylase biotin carboxyl carrier protein